MVKVECNRGYIKAVAVVTKRLRTLEIDGKPFHHVGVPIHWGFKGLAKPGFIANTLTNFVGDAKFADTGIQVLPRPGGEAVMALQSLDIVRRSATTLPEPEFAYRWAREQVSKLIDTTKCIGCKACQVACMEWNDLRDEVGTNIGHTRTRTTWTNTWTLMRFAEVENPKGDLEWLIRKDGCMHCAGPGLSEGLPVTGRDRAVLQRHRGFPRRKLHRLRLLRYRLSV